MTTPLTWITDRPPTEADGDEDGDVVALCDGRKGWYATHWESVYPGQPWLPFSPPGATPEPAAPTSQPSIECDAHDADSVAAVADDGSAWWLSADGTEWTPLPALPNR